LHQKATATSNCPCFGILFLPGDAASTLVEGFDPGKLFYFKRIENLGFTVLLCGSI